MQLPEAHRAMISILKFSGEEITGAEIARRLSWGNTKVDRRLIADFKNKINEFAVDNDLSFIICSFDKGYQYINTVDYPDAAEQAIERNMITLTNRALNTLKNRGTLKKALRKIKNPPQKNLFGETV